jgi:hypothetical protein
VHTRAAVDLGRILAGQDHCLHEPFLLGVVFFRIGYTFRATPASTSTRATSWRVVAAPSRCMDADND